MIVVSDTSCVSNLITIAHARLLSELFGEVIIPPAVEAELRRFHSELPGFLRIVSPQNTKLLMSLTRELHAGEAEAICLAHELKAERLLIDEKRGRSVATREGVPIIGIIGILLLAKERKLVPSLGTLLQQLETDAGFRLADAVKASALNSAGESI